MVQDRLLSLGLTQADCEVIMKALEKYETDLNEVLNYTEIIGVYTVRTILEGIYITALDSAELNFNDFEINDDDPQNIFLTGGPTGSACDSSEALRRIKDKQQIAEITELFNEVELTSSGIDRLILSLDSLKTRLLRKHAKLTKHPHLGIRKVTGNSIEAILAVGLPEIQEHLRPIWHSYIRQCLENKGTALVPGSATVVGNYELVFNHSQNTPDEN